MEIVLRALGALLLTFGVLGSAWAACPRQQALEVAGKPVVAETACSEAQRTRGLMGRRQLPAGQGMVFVYPGDVESGFWMKDTPLPLSIAFIDGDGVILELRDMEPYSEAAVYPWKAYRYALEVPQGWYARHGVKVGDRVKGLSGLHVEE